MHGSYNKGRGNLISVIIVNPDTLEEEEFFFAPVGLPKKKRNSNQFVFPDLGNDSSPIGSLVNPKNDFQNQMAISEEFSSDFSQNDQMILDLGLAPVTKPLSDMDFMSSFDYFSDLDFDLGWNHDFEDGNA